MLYLFVLDGSVGFDEQGALHGSKGCVWCVVKLVAKAELQPGFPVSK